MKRAKLFKLLTKSLILLLMCFGGVFFGVTLALSSSNVNTGGSVNFVATDVMADITGSVNGTATQSTLKDINITWSTSQDEINNMSSSWRGLILDFVKETNSVTLTINIKNKSSERAVSGLVTDNFNISNITTTRKVGENSVSSFSEVTILPNATHSFSISMSVTDLAKSVEGTWSLAINLTNQGIPDGSAYQIFDFAYDTANNTAQIKANSGNKPTGELVIPSKVMHNGEEYEVTSIGESAFNQCTSLKSVVIPASVTSIGGFSFENCSNLDTVTFEEESKVMSIGESAFRYCTSLASVNIPASVNSILAHAFTGCSNLTSITVDENNSKFTGYENGIYMGTTLIVGCQTTIIKEGTTVLNVAAFCGQTKLKTIKIPDSVLDIRSSVFYDCTSLEGITLPKNLTVIGSWAFANTSIQTITIPESVTYIYYRAFNTCSKLKTVYFENPKGWSVLQESTTIPLSEDDLADPEKASTLFVEYRHESWQRT